MDLHPRYIHRRRKTTKDSKWTMLPLQPKWTYHSILSQPRSTSSRSLYIKHSSRYCPDARTSKRSAKGAGPHRHPPRRTRRSSGLLCRRIVRQKGFSQCLNLAAWARALRISMYNSRYQSMQIPVLFESAHATAEQEVLVDSGATDNFISKNLLH